MNSKPKWIWKQRVAVGSFLLSFYLRRTLRFIGESLSFLPRRVEPATPVKSLPRRRLAEVSRTPPGAAQRARRQRATGRCGSLHHSLHEPG